MRNWLGQDIQVGSIVYRGARAGNTSEYKVGVVESLDEDKGKARVHWRFDPYSYFWRTDPAGNRERIKSAVGRMDGRGSPDINSLVVLDVNLDVLESKVELAEEWRNSDMPTAEYEARLAELDSQV